MKLSLGLSLALLGALTSAHAAPVRYNIQFTTTSGSPAPTSGSFFYDSDVPVFSNFLVVWNGISFDMTAAANNPTFAMGACNTAGNGAADTFDFLLNQNCGSGQYFNGWGGFGYGFASGFTFERSDAENLPTNAISFSAIDSSTDNTSAQGTFSISLAEAPVPEPATLSMLTAAAALLAVRLRMRRSGRGSTPSRKRAVQ